MTLTKRGKYWFGETAEDVRGEMVRYSTANAYPAVRFAGSVCSCGGIHFRLETDEDDGLARRTCIGCGNTHLMGDSAEYADDAHPEGHECVCGNDVFALESGVALYDGSNDVRWYYIGCRCSQCRLVGVFADWKCEAGDADEFLAAV